MGTKEEIAKLKELAKLRKQRLKDIKNDLKDDSNEEYKLRMKNIQKQVFITLYGKDKLDIFEDYWLNFTSGRVKNLKEYSQLINMECVYKK